MNANITINLAARPRIPRYVPNRLMHSTDICTAASRIALLAGKGDVRTRIDNTGTKLLVNVHSEIGSTTSLSFSTPIAHVLSNAGITEISISCDTTYEEICTLLRKASTSRISKAQAALSKMGTTIKTIGNSRFSKVPEKYFDLIQPGSITSKVNFLAGFVTSAFLAAGQTMTDIFYGMPPYQGTSILGIGTAVALTGILSGITGGFLGWTGLPMLEAPLDILAEKRQKS